MSNLSLYLPPFAADYSGACSVLFDYDCLTVILDAGCCTRNYVEYDEPRWETSRKLLYSAQIRSMDVVLGDEAALIKQIGKALTQISPSFIALVATPVPAIVGMDVDGIALEIEQQFGIPCISIKTNGFDTYEQGVSRTYLSLVKRFSKHGKACSNEAASADTAEATALFGHTLMDYKKSMPIVMLFPETLANCKKSYVASISGLEVAKYLLKTHGIPFSFVSSECDCNAIIESLAASYDKLLLVGDQIRMNALRKELQEAQFMNVCVASFFQMDTSFMQPNDFRIHEDSDLMRAVNENLDVGIVGDPLLLRLPGITKQRLYPVQHRAVSSMLFD